MPAGGAVPRLRQVATWLLFASSIVSLVVSRQWIGIAIQAMGTAYPRNISPNLPILTKWLLEHLHYFDVYVWVVVLAALLSVALTVRSAVGREARLHTVSLITSVVYHATLMMWAAFTLGYFILPHVKAGI